MSKTNYLRLIIFFLGIQLVSSQSSQKLEEKNGFREIKLGNNITDYPNFIKKNSENDQYFGPWIDFEYILDLKSTRYDKIGNATIHRIFAKTHENKIYAIKIILEKNYEVIELLKSLYGEPTWDNLQADLIEWKTNKIECTFKGRYKGASNFHIDYVQLELEKLALKKSKEVKLKKANSEF